MVGIEIFPYDGITSYDKITETDPFRYTPDYGLSHKIEANVVTQVFGDGYEQRVPLGLNYITHKITPTWSNMPWSYTADPESEQPANKIYNFLEKRLKTKPFRFKDHPESEERIYICEELSYSLSRFGLANITATFQEYKGA